MIPYLAIIKDSFRAAAQSRTLKALLVGVTLLLISVGLFGYTETLTGHIHWREVWDWQGLMDEVYEAQQDPRPSPGTQVWALLSDKFKAEANSVYEQLEDLRQQEEKDNEEGLPVTDAAERETPEEESADDDEPSDPDAQRAKFSQQRNALSVAFHFELDEYVLTNPDLYDKEAWADFEFNDELKERLKTRDEDTSEVEIRRLNRLLLETAFFRVPRSPPVSVQPTYAGYQIGTAEGNTKDAVIEWYRGRIGMLMDWPVSMSLVFIAIIVTSGIMPRMFEPGSISLLLSKPITRSRLFLAQFAGACAFMLVASVYFTVGIWFIAAVRLGILNPQIFWCIPLFTFTFMVYYAVSAYVGIVYRSAIMSVIAVISMFYLCFFVGTFKVMYEDMVVDAARMVHVIDTGEVLVASDDPISRPIRHYSFDEETRQWRDVFTQRTIGSGDRAIYDPRGDQLLAVETPPGIGIITQQLSVGPASEGWVRESGSPLPPTTLALLTESDGHVLAVSRLGFYRMTGDAIPEEDGTEGGFMPLGAPNQSGEPGEQGQGGDEPIDEAEAGADPPTADASDTPADATAEPNDETGDEKAIEPRDDKDSSDAPSDSNTRAEEIPTELPPAIDEAPLEQDPLDMFKEVGSFERIGPEKDPPAEPPMSVAIGPSDTLFICANGQMAVYKQGEDGNYTESARDELENGYEKATSLAVTVGGLVVARDDGKVFILNSDTLAVEQEFQPESETSVRLVKASASGRWAALLFQNRKLWLYDARERELTKANIWTQGDISAVGFSDDRLLIVDRIARVREFELPDLKETRTFTPKEIPYLSETSEIFPGVEMSWYLFHRWFITPMYTILPKPGELGWAVNYLATGEQSQVSMFTQMQTFFLQMMGVQRGEGTDAQRHQLRNPWRGVRSCAIFIVFMLCLSCWHISRTEF